MGPEIAGELDIDNYEQWSPAEYLFLSRSRNAPYILLAIILRYGEDKLMSKLCSAIEYLNLYAEKKPKELLRMHDELLVIIQNQKEFEQKQRDKQRLNR